MDRGGLKIYVKSLSRDLDPQKVRKLSIERCLITLEQAYQCQEESCSEPSCNKMTRVIMHTYICERKAQGGCQICLEMLSLCCYHAKRCKESKCWLPLCSILKKKMGLLMDMTNMGDGAAASPEQASTSSRLTAQMQPHFQQNLTQQIGGAVGGMPDGESAPGGVVWEE